MPDLTEAEQIGAYAQEANEAQDVDRGTLVVIGSQVVDLAKYDDRPRRTIRNAQIHTAEGLTRYKDRHGLPGTTLYVDARSASFLLVVDGDEHRAHGEELGWGHHTAKLQLQASREWTHWTSGDGKLMDQATFAQHIEDGLPEITSPEGAAMLELAQSIEATTSADFKSATRLTSGQRRITYQETITAKAGQAGELLIPETFTLQLPVFDGSSFAQELTARFRYRLNAGSLGIGYRLVRPDDAWRQEVADVVNELEEATELDAIAGWPSVT